MDVFEQYGIKEVADMTLYSIHKKKDGSGELYYVPALYLDTLKVSTVEKTADNVWAEGGLGNSRLICWDFNKQINVSLEDALCTPASLGLCWNGILSADWQDAQIQYNTDVCICQNPLTKMSRIEKCFYPRQDNITIGQLLPHLSDDQIDNNMGILKESSIVDGTDVRGFGLVKNHSYKWKMVIESAINSIAVVPDRFFDVNGRSYSIDQDRKVSMTTLPTYTNYKDAVIYKINVCNSTSPAAKIIFDDYMENGNQQNQNSTTNTISHEGGHIVNYFQNEATTALFNHLTKDESLIRDELGSVKNDIKDFIEIEDGDFLAIIVDNENEYYALIGKGIDKEYYENEDYIAPIQWYKPKTTIDVSQFKNIDMWLRFSSTNSLIYYLLTKYEDDIVSIKSATIDANEYEEHFGGGDGMWAVNKQRTTKQYSNLGSGKLWAYVNPRTMQPYEDDYWFHQGEPYYIKSLTFAPKSKSLKGHKLVVKVDQWPGMYMAVGETFIRNRDTGIDERMQIKFPLCKVKSDHSLTLEADGDPVVFNIEMEVARPSSGIMMELTSYEIAEKLIEGDNGCFYAVDGSTEILSE